MNIYNKLYLHNKIKIIIPSVLIFFCCILTAHAYSIKQSYNTIQNQPCFYYTIKKGDTLWDLSRKFYNSNWVWPGLWGINGKIKNPHVIYPGEKIKIFLRKKFKKQKTATKILSAKKPKITVTFYYPGLSNLSFIKKQRIEPIGDILKSRNQNVMIAQSDIIYIEPIKKDSMTPGKEYAVFTAKKINYKYHGKKLKEIKHTIIGIIKIIKNNGKYLTAKVIRSFRDMAKGNMIMDKRKADNEIIVRSHIDKINAEIICSDNDNTIIGERDIVFINCGSHDNIKNGQIYNIFKKQSISESDITKNKIKLAPEKIGSLIVLHTEDTASTAMILSTRMPVKLGDIIH